MLLGIITSGESLTVEFKSGSVTDAEVVAAVCCLANAHGGQLIIGVDDRGAVGGAPPRHGSSTQPSRLVAMVANRTEPPLVVSVESHLVEAVEVLVLGVPVGGGVVATNDGRYLRRALDLHGRPQCLPMRPHEVMSRASSIGVQDYSRVLRPDATMDDLDLTEFARYRDAVSSGGDRSLSDLSPVETLRALNLISAEGQIANGALLLFGRESSIARLLPTHEVAFTELDGLAVRVNEVSRAPLLRAMTELADRVRARSPEDEVQSGLFRVGLPRFADVAFRELIANALVHRDYAVLGATRVEITAHQLTVTNPGGLPEGLTLLNLLTAPPRPRNPSLADAFKRAGLVERVGRGINRVFENQIANGRPAPHFGRSSGIAVVADLRSGPFDIDLAVFLAEERRSGRLFALPELLVLYELRHHSDVSAEHAGELIQLGEDAARDVLLRLVDRGLLQSLAGGRRYALRPSLRGRLGGSSTGRAGRALDRLRQERLVVRHVADHGSITRREAAELCGLELTAAGRLLQRMRIAGTLVVEGERKGARYVLPV